MQAVVGALRANLSLDAAQFEQGTKRAQNSLKSMRTQFLAVAGTAAALGAAISAAALNGARGIDEAAKASRRLEASVGGFRALELAASEAGVSVQGLANDMQTLGREVASGSAGATRALQALRLSASELAGLDVDQRAALIADRIREMGLSADQTTALLRDLGIRNREMILLFMQGGDAIRSARADIEDYGLALSAIDTQRIEQARDQIGRLSIISQRFQEQLALALVPAMGAFAQTLTDSMREGEPLRRVVDGLAQNVDRLATFVGVAVVALGTRYVAAAGLAYASTLTLAGAMVGLRTAMLRTGIGALIVLAGEAVLQFDKLRGAADTIAPIMDEAKAATDKLNEVLGTSSEVALPAAARAALNLTNENIKLAKSAYAAAEAEIAKATAAAQAAQIQRDLEQAFSPTGTFTAADENLAAQMARLTKANADLRAAQSDLTARIEEGQLALSEASDAMAESSARTVKFAVDMTTLENSIGGGGGSNGGAVAALDDAVKATEALNEQMQEAPKFVNDFANAFGDLAASGFRDWKTFTSSIVNSFRQAISQMVADWIRSPLQRLFSGGGGQGGRAQGGGMLGGLLPSPGSGTGFLGGLGNAMGGGVFNFGNNAMAAGGGLMASMGAALPVIGMIGGAILGGIMSNAQRQAERWQAKQAKRLQRVEREAARRDAELEARLRSSAEAVDNLIASLRVLDEMQREREQAARAVLAERDSLEVELLRINNDLVALREREINALDPLNRQLGRFIASMRDVREAIEEQERAAQALAGAGRGIVEFVTGVRGAETALFARDLELARGGDLDASGRVVQSARGAQATFGATATSAVDMERFNRRMANDLMALPAVASHEEQQVALLEEIRDGIGGLKGLEMQVQTRLRRAIEDGFFNLDENLDGKLTFDELRRGLGSVASDRQLRALLSATDRNGDGTISRLESIDQNSAHIDENTLENYLAAIDQLSELKLIAGETASNSERVAHLTTAINNLIFSQRQAASSTVGSLQQQREAAAAALQDAQARIARTDRQIKQKPSRLQRALGARTQKSPNPAHVALEADIRRLLQEIAALDAQLANVPAFAAGGFHTGGLRLVGEHGPELEATGPSRIFSNSDMTKMLSGGRDENLRDEIVELQRMMVAVVKYTKRTSDTLRDWERIGLPDEREFS